MKIDLQIHTNHSDGINSPSEIAELSLKGGLDIISITDHDIISAVKIVQAECDRFDIRVIPAVEIGTVFKSRTIHILGYNIDIESQQLISFLNRNIEYRKQSLLSQLPILNNNLRRAGKAEVEVSHYKNKDPKYYSKPGLAVFMYEEKVVDNYSEAFGYFNGIKNTVFPIEPAEAFSVIHRAGGKAILSHPLAPKVSLKEISLSKLEQEEMVVQFIDQGLNGLECYTTGHSEKDIEFCLEMCKKYNLLITAGSDWHGPLEQKEEGIKEYLPYYLTKLGDLVVPEKIAIKIIEDLGIVI